MRISAALIVFIWASTVAGQQPAGWELPNFSDRIDFTVANPGGNEMKALAILDIAEIRKLAPEFPGTLVIATEQNARTSFLASQTDDLDGDGQPDEVAVAVELAPHQKKLLSLYYSTTLHDNIPVAKRVHATHRYGYNQATVALESELIGYRTYGGFFFDVQAHRRGHTGLFNSLLGYSRTSASPVEGEDVIHLGDTLGLGGLFLRAGGITYRPTLSTPDYAHRSAKTEEPIYRVVTDGPLRAIVEARLPSWTIGRDKVSLRAVYEIDGGNESVRCRWWLIPARLSHTYEVGAGIRDLPERHVIEGKHLVVTSGVQESKIGQVALGVSFEPSQAQRAGVLQTPDGGNQIVIFRKSLGPHQPLSGDYMFAAAWAGSGWSDPAFHVRDVLLREAIKPEVRVIAHVANPQPRTLEGEPN